MMPDHSKPVVHLELHTGDLRAGRRVLRAAVRLAAASRSTPSCGSYLALDLASALGGGIVECATQRPLWLPYVEVAEIAEATDRARLFGA